MKKIIFTVLSCVFIFVFYSCNKNENKQTDSQMNIAVFLPGVRAGSPVYEMLASGVEEAVNFANRNGKNVEVKILEAGTNQADWGTKLTSLAVDGKYGLIISSNPSLPQIAEPVSKQFPNQKFLLLDAYSEGNPMITTFRYNQREQAYIAGYISALVSLSNMKYANAEKKLGLIAGQEYPAMLNTILPAFLEGARAADNDFTVDFRIVGNWYDAAKGAELARAMYEDGADVIMPISGGANQGVLAAAKELGFYVSWFDDNGYAKAEGYVVSSSEMKQKQLAYEQTLNFIEGRLNEGSSNTLGIKDGYVNFISDDPIYIETVPEEIRNKQEAMLKKIADGSLDLSIK
ncbi:BMP family ABC transporter substrate-binding protein [Treponema pedis]|uniref:Lipoprotein n=2 Tax=Treponema pedis TaxID=409322 RepID=S6A8B8_9SPIR|nr:BMP family ABC transporter substrate-binding protein [Treponema pedis]AGT43554.1 lipoprotein [Treponema pedis str. T A4]